MKKIISRPTHLCFESRIRNKWKNSEKIVRMRVSLRLTPIREGGTARGPLAHAQLVGGVSSRAESFLPVYRCHIVYKFAAMAAPAAPAAATPSPMINLLRLWAVRKSGTAWP